MKIYLVRHGLVDYSNAQLSSEGQAFAKKLPSLIPGKIDFLAVDDEQRCSDTVKFLSTMKGIPISKYGKSQFLAKKPLSDCPQTGNSVICYRIEGINGILAELGIPQFTQANRDTAYEKIIECTKTAGPIKTRIINTGFKRL